MAFQPESPVFDAGVLQLETTTPVQGGVGGAANSPLLSLSNRTAYLKSHMDALEAASSGYAPLNSPAFTGSPTVPDVALGDRSAKAANTKFVEDTVYSVLTKNVGGGANVNLTAVEAGNGILVFTGVLTAAIAVIVPSTAKKWAVVNSTTGAFALTVKTAAGTGVAVSQGFATFLACDATNVFDPKTDFPNLALSGNPTAPTPPQFDNDTSVATTAFVQRALGNWAGSASYNVSTVLTAANVGKPVVFSGSTANQTLTLPALAGLNEGSCIPFVNTASVSVSIAPTGADLLSQIRVGQGVGGLASLRLGVGDQTMLFKFGGAWYEIGGLRNDNVSTLACGSQSWQDMSASRSISTTYTNTSGRPIVVGISGQSIGAPGSYSIQVAGIVAANATQPAGSSFFLSAVVPAGATYILTKGGADTYSQVAWGELR